MHCDQPDRQPCESLNAAECASQYMQRASWSSQEIASIVKTFPTIGLLLGNLTFFLDTDATPESLSDVP